MVLQVELKRALLESAISIKWITLLLARGLVLENDKRKVILLYISETQPIGETEEEILDLMAIFGNDGSNDITQGGLFLQKLI